MATFLENEINAIERERHNGPTAHVLIMFPLKELISPLPVTKAYQVSSEIYMAGSFTRESP